MARIELGREVEQILSYIELQQLRASEEDDGGISFAVAGETDDLLIAPMLLILIASAFSLDPQVSSCCMGSLPVLSRQNRSKRPSADRTLARICEDRRSHADP